ncbi:hypothetical protein [Povalibacter sp.]|uniref:hypothetical protein n=1 Tax=Povalibacter sp. TaxID=1962978 RepID=UPI002F428FB9
MFELLFTHPQWAWRTGTFAFANGWSRWALAVCVVIAAALIVLTLLRRRSLGASRLLTLGTLQLLFITLLLCLAWRPVLHIERVRDRENVLAVALDTSASMALDDRPDAARPQSRLQHAVSALQSSALNSLQQSFEVRLFSFSSRAESLSSLDAMPPPGTQTRIGDSLVQLLQTASSVPLAGIVLLSDGVDNGETLSEERLAEIASFGVPVHTVGVGAETIPDDLELEQVRVARVAPAGATVTAAVRVRHDAAGSTRLRVYDHDKLLAAEVLQLPATTSVSTHSIEFPVGDPGTHDLRFTLDALEGERDLVNNSRSHVLDVPAERRRILYVEGEPRWEYKFLRRAVEPERSLHLTSMVRTTPNKYFRQGVRSGAELQRGFPTDAAELFAYDAVIIGSFDAATLSVQQHQLLRQFVDQRGGSVLLLAGNNGLSAGGWERAALAQTLPTHLPSKQAQSFVQRTAAVRPTLYAADSAITRLDADATRNAEAWQTLPKLADYQSLGKLKPGAIVLLETTTEQGAAPLLVWQRFGQGATYLLGTASTLRWQMRLAPDDQRHELFWRQLAHAVADGALPRTALASGKSVYDDERQVRMDAQLRNARFEPIDAAQVELLVAPEHDEPYRVPMQPSDAGAGRYVASFDAPATGLYRVDMTARTPDGDMQSATAYVRRNDGLLEHYGARQDRAVLTRIAGMTGGRYWQLADLEQLAAAIPYSRAGIVERRTLELWNLPIVFLTLLALLAAEWLLRLKWGRL